MRISKSFSDDLRAAELLTLRVSWNADTGKAEFAESVTPAQRAAYAAVLAAHDPDKRPDPAVERGQDRAEALASLVGQPEADAAFDDFLKSIKTRADLPPAVAAYIAKHRL